MNYRLHVFPHYCVYALWTGEETMLTKATMDRLTPKKMVKAWTNLCPFTGDDDNNNDNDDGGDKNDDDID